MKAEMKVELLSHTPSEAICATAAHCCVSQKIDVIDGEENIRKSTRHSIQSGHDSILEHWSATFAISGVSRAFLAQLSRHRLISLSVQSQRYVNMNGFDYVIPESIEKDEKVKEKYVEFMRATSDLYEIMTELHNIKEEDARYILPNACTTNIVFTANARELKHIFSLRTCNRTQKEFRDVANEMMKICKEVAPIIFEGAGAQCERTGYCVESRGCGKYPKKKC